MVTYGRPQRRRKNGRLTATYWIRCYDPASRRQFWRSTRCRSLAAAKEWVTTQEVYQALGCDRRRQAESHQRTFALAYDSWIAEKREKVSPTHCEDLESRGKAFWQPFFGTRVLDDLTPELVQEYFRRRRSGAIRKSGDLRSVRRITATTLNNDLRYLRSFFRYCRERGWLSDDPMRGIQAYSAVMKRRTRTITLEEEERLLAACRDGAVVTVSAKRNKGGRKGRTISETEVVFVQRVPAPNYLYPAVLVALRCGFRRRTLLSLRWCDIDFRKSEWRIPAEFLKTAEDYNAPVPPGVVDELKAFRRQLADGADTESGSIPERIGPDAPIFGLPQDAKIRRSFQTAVRRAGLQLTFHDLRRIFLNRLRERGVSIEAAMALTGHKSLQTVLAHYREVPVTELRRAVEALDRGHGDEDALASRPSTSAYSGR